MQNPSKHPTPRINTTPPLFAPPDSQWHPTPTVEEEVDALAKRIDDTLRNALHAAGRQKHNRGRASAWWNNKCKEARQRYNEVARGSRYDEP